MSNWEDTKKLYSNYITYPELNQKYLKRPPFKYILSIISSVSKKSDYLVDKIPKEELEAEFYTEAKKKAKLLQLVIKEVDNTLGIKQQIEIKSILKGEECDKTNIFLQNIYKAAIKYSNNTPDQNNKNENNNTPNNNPHTPAPVSITNRIQQNINNEEKNNNLRVESNNNQESQEDDVTKQLDMIINEGKEIIQKITQNSNPLSTIVEFIEDDIDMMQRENDKWIKTYKNSQKQLSKLNKEGEDELQNNYDRLAEIEEQIVRKQNKINNKKSQIFQNDKKIDNLIQKIIDK